MKLEKEIKTENFQEIEDRGKRLEALMNLSKKIRDQERRLPIPFNDFLYLASTDPENFFRDIFQLFHDMVHFYMPEGIEEYPDSPDSVGFVGYDSSKLFVEGQDNPFFADRLFANRLMNLVEGFKSGNLKNHIFLFEGPPGSGKSTFLNNILLKLEEYTRTKEGTIYKTYWRMDIEKLGGFPKFQGKLFEHTQDTDIRALSRQMAATHLHYIERPQKYLQFSCPRHDHPVLQIPKSYRKQFLDELIPDGEFKEKLFHKKEYEWVLKDIPCNICKSLFTTLLDILGDPLEVFNMLTARKAVFNRQFGEGISIFNPGDPPANKPITNETLQKMINNLLKTDNIDFIYSTLAKTNNGILALMDIKEHNIDRLKNLHGIISDGVHKVELIEEQIKSLFLGILNPEDRVHFENVESFRDRIITVNINYILDYNTEVSIYKNKFGKDIEKFFLPRVLENFAKIIISSRMDTDSKVIQNWLKDGDKYKKYQDKNYLLLKMDIYSGKIPDWLSDDDLKRFDKPTRRAVLATSEKEGKSGFSGRMSLNIFNEFYSKKNKNGGLINMEDVQKYFIDNEDLYAEIPKGFITSLVDLYDYNVLQEVKESVYYYNEKQITNDILNYMYAINFDTGNTETCDYTGDKIDITEEFFKTFELRVLGSGTSEQKRQEFRKEMLTEYIQRTMSQEMAVEDKKVTATTQFNKLFDKYVKNLKENALAPYAGNENFRRAILDFGKTAFDKYDRRLKNDVERLLENLQNKFHYNEEGAREVSIYVLEKKLADKY